VDETRERRWNFWYWVGVAVVAYLVPLIILAIDVGCGSRLRALLGPEVESVVNIIYWPVTLLIEHVVKRLGG